MTDNSHKAMPRVLLVEDDLDTATYIERSPTLAHVALTVVADGTQGRNLAFNESWDCIILDRRLPGLDGLNILEDIRTADIRTPILFLTTMDGISDRVTGLRRGADDYLVKPFSVTELSARLDVLLRRTRSHPQETRLIFADVELDLLQREVHRSGQKLYIQSQELNLLEYFMRRPFAVVTREMLLQSVWNIDFPIRTNLVETHISRLRERLGRGAPPLIHTIRGQGYVLRHP